MVVRQSKCSVPARALAVGSIEVRGVVGVQCATVLEVVAPARLQINT